VATLTDTPGLRAAVALALEMIPPGSVIGLGSGRAATAFVRALGQRVRDGLRIRGVPTSQATADLAKELGIALATLGDVGQLAVTVDGADEVDPQLDLIKGLGGALVREKIVAAASERLIIVAGTEKCVEQLGSHGVLPVEVVPFGVVLCSKRLAALGCTPLPREVMGKLFVTDNQNYILDCQITALANAAELERQILAIPGVVGTGLFLGMAQTVLIYDNRNVRKLVRSP
jgi:ribose 5-phosphate isomerase A